MFEPESNWVVWGVSPMLLIVGATCHIASIATPHWQAGIDTHQGLWTHCTAQGKCVSITEQINHVDNMSWYRTVQGLEVASTVFVLASLVTGLMRVNLGHRMWQAACGVSAILAGVLGVIGAGVFADNYDNSDAGTLSWAFIFNAIGSAMTFLAGPIIIVDVIVHKG